MFVGAGVVVIQNIESPVKTKNLYQGKYCAIGLVIKDVFGGLTIFFLFLNLYVE